MELLLNNASRIMPKNLLIEKIWGLDSDAEYNNLEVYISFLRQKIAFLGPSTQIRPVICPMACFESRRVFIRGKVIPGMGLKVVLIPDMLRQEVERLRFFKAWFKGIPAYGTPFK